MRSWRIASTVPKARPGNRGGGGWTGPVRAQLEPAHSAWRMALFDPSSAPFPIQKTEDNFWHTNLAKPFPHPSIFLMIHLSPSQATFSGCCPPWTSTSSCGPATPRSSRSSGALRRFRRRPVPARAGGVGCGERRWWKSRRGNTNKNLKRLCVSLLFPWRGVL